MPIVIVISKSIELYALSPSLTHTHVFVCRTVNVVPTTNHAHVAHSSYTCINYVRCTFYMHNILQLQFKHFSLVVYYYATIIL